jgi:hypothetical protein
MATVTARMTRMRVWLFVILFARYTVSQTALQVSFEYPPDAQMEVNLVDGLLADSIACGLLIILADSIACGLLIIFALWSGAESVSAMGLLAGSNSHCRACR